MAPLSQCRGRGLALLLSAPWQTQIGLLQVLCRFSRKFQPLEACGLTSMNIENGLALKDAVVLISSSLGLVKLNQTHSSPSVPL